MRLTNKVTEANRVMGICNACRYCEGHCAVFQAMELRIEFNSDNLDYLSNLCHNCGACYHNCQYAPPHEFKVNVPAAMAELRQENYSIYAWPSGLGKLYSNNGLWVSGLSIIILTLFLFGISFLSGDRFGSIHDNGFYGVISHNTMALLFGFVGLYVVFALIISCVKYWRVMKLPALWKLNWTDVFIGIKNALTLKYLDGGNGQGCSYPTDKPSMSRRWFHQLTFWGFIFCFMATITGTIMHYGFNLPAPYGYISLPKFFGIIGGIGLLIGPMGLLFLKKIAIKDVKGKTNKGMDTAFLVLLLLTSLSGLLLMLLKYTIFVGIALSIHLAIVLTLFLTMPYGKFIHGFYRIISLIVFSVERSQNKAIVGVNIPITDITNTIKKVDS